MMIVGDEKLTFVEGSIRRSVGPALVEAAVARQSGGGIALRGSAIARIGGASLAAEAVSLENFFYQGRFEERMRDARLSLARRSPPARCRCSGRANSASPTATGARRPMPRRGSAPISTGSTSPAGSNGNGSAPPTARNWPISTSSRSPRAGSARSACGQRALGNPPASAAAQRRGLGLLVGVGQCRLGSRRRL